MKQVNWQLLGCLTWVLLGALPHSVRATVAEKSLRADLLRRAQVVDTWVQNPRVAQSVARGQVVVSTVKESLWLAKGIGEVKAPAEFVFAMAQDFAAIKKLTGLFTELEWEAEKQELTATFRFLGLERVLKLSWFPEPSKEGRGEEHRIYWQIIEGQFQGSLGLLRISSKRDQLCLVNLYMENPESVGGLSALIFRFASEALMERMALALRDMAEKKWIKVSRL